MAAGLSFIKLRNVGGGTVEVHLDALEGGSYKRIGDYTSDFSPADADNGTWQLFGSQNGAPILGFIKLRNVGSGTVEVHLDALEGSSYKRIGDYTSDFGPADADIGAWQLFGSQNGAPILGFIKLQQVGSGKLEVHLDALEGGSYKRIGDYTSDFFPSDAGLGTWQLFASSSDWIRGSQNGVPILGFIKLQQVGRGKLEVHLDALEGGSYKRIGDYTSDFLPSDANNGVWSLQGLDPLIEPMDEHS
jgi:hypothetical protein